MFGGDEDDFPALGAAPTSKSKGRGRGAKTQAPPPKPQAVPGELSQAAPPKKAAAPPPQGPPKKAAAPPPEAGDWPSLGGPKAAAAAPKPVPKKAAAPVPEAAPAPADAPKAPAPAAAPAPAPEAPAAPPAAAPAPTAAPSAQAPRRFGADDYEAAAEDDAAAGQKFIPEVEEQEDKLALEIPPLALGKSGRPLKLVSNHFHLSVRSTGPETIWRCWRVDFTRVEEDKPKDFNEKKMPKKKGDDDRELPKNIRKQAVEILLGDVPRTDWLHDGNNLLYTRKSVTKLQDQRTMVEVPPTRPGGRAFKAMLEVKFEGREINLSWLHQPLVDKDPSQAMVSMSEHRRFVQVAVRTLAQEREELIASGRKVVCADNRLVCDAVALKYGREMWFGYIGQVEIVNGGIGVGGKLAPARSTLSLNLVASVGIPAMPMTTLLGKLGARYPGDKRSEADCERDVVWRYWDRDYGNLRDAVRGEMGFRRLRVMVEYGKVKQKGKLVCGVTDKPADRTDFDCEEMGGKVNVVQYFQHKHGIKVQYPGLPCVQVGSTRVCIPMEFVHVMGGEHNLAVGKLRPEFQQEVTRRTAMPPSQRRDQIMQALANKELGPTAALKPKGIDMDVNMISLTGRQLDTPKLRDGNSGTTAMRDSTNYSNGFRAVAPPQFEVQWGLWTFSTSKYLSERDVQWLADEFKKKCSMKGMRFSDPKFVEWPEKAFNSYFQCHKYRESFSLKMGDEVRADLQRVARDHKDLKLLVILLEDSEAITDHLYKLVKLITETEIGTFTTQFINCKKGIQDAEKKLNNIMLKVSPKVPYMPTGMRAAHNVCLHEPWGLLKKEEGTMIMGADVTHKVSGISVAGVVASTDSSYASYFHEIRGQSPYTLNTLKVRQRQSEERIIQLASMTQNLVERWKKCNNTLPKTVIYYRDGVSDGQFINVLTRELNLLEEGFKRVSTSYNPQLVIIVGQKRHQTRMWMADGGIQPADKGKGKDGKGKDKGKDDKGKGKGKGKDTAQVPPGTVASDGIAQPSHMNFFLVSQQGIQGTSVPCHYHVLHLDQRLVKRGIKVDDFETITFQLCHMYSRADKSVGYATPAYMADHVCERGKHYLEANFGSSDIMSTMGSSSSEERKEAEMKEQIDERIEWLNKRAAASANMRLNGLQMYC